MQCDLHGSAAHVLDIGRGSRHWIGWRSEALVANVILLMGVALVSKMVRR